MDAITDHFTPLALRVRGNKQLKLNAISGMDPAKGVFNILHT